MENPGVNCLHDFDKDDVASCTVYFSVCKPLPLKICDVANVTYCEVVTDKSGTEHKYIIGKYTIRHSFLAHSMLIMTLSVVSISLMRSVFF